MRAVLGGFLLLALAGCAPALTEIVVVVDSDLAVPSAMDRVEIRVSNDVAMTTVAATSLTGASPGHLPATVGVRPQQDTSASLTIVAAGMLGGADVVTAEVRTRFVSGRRVVLSIFLSSACRGVTCPHEMTCRSGTCVSSTVDPSTLPPFDGHLPDGGMDAATDGSAHDAGDASRPDTGPPPDAGPGCTTDVDCSDGHFCNGSEICFEHACGPGTPPSCDDSIACTADSCDPTLNACAHMALDALCTLVAGGHCDIAHGGCQYPTCDATTCAPTPGTCETASCTGTTCNRASTCMSGQTCCAGSCGAGGCDDGNGCTDDSCGASGCVHAANSAPCSDGDACTVGDRCGGAACTAGTPTSCDDGVACTHDSCSGGSCAHMPDNALCTMSSGGTCDLTMGCQYSSCTTTTCASDPSMCVTASCAGSMCNRVSSCTGTQICCAGTCAAAGCDDGNGCTDDSCGLLGCVHSPRAGSCDDGNACTTPDSCSGGTCAAGPAVSCDDGRPCTTDGCSPVSGCGHTYLPYGTPCDDQSLCTTTSACNDTGDCIIDTYVACSSDPTCATFPPDCYCVNATGCMNFPGRPTCRSCP